MLVRVAMLAAGATALILALGTMNATVQGTSPYVSALEDLSITNASAEPSTCSDKKCGTSKLGLIICKDGVGFDCHYNPEDDTCFHTQC